MRAEMGLSLNWNQGCKLPVCQPAMKLMANELRRGDGVHANCASRTSR